jgi:uncharacterized protein (DUF885 family)
MPPEPATLATAVDEIINENLAMRPSRATDAGDHRWDRELDDFSRTGIDAEVKRLRAAVARLERVESDDPKALLPARIDAATVRNALDKDLFSLTEEREPATNPLIYAQLMGDAIHGLLARPFAPLADRLESVAARLAKLPQVISAARANLEDPPAIHVSTTAAQVRGLGELLAHDVRGAAAGTKAEAKIGEATTTAIAALEDFARWLERELAPKAGGSWRLGPDKFAKKLALAHDDPRVTPAALLAAARAAHAELRAEMAELAGKLHESVASGCRHDDDAALVRCVLDACAKEHASPEDLLTEARATCDELTAFLRRAKLVPMPDAKNAPLQIDWLPRYLAGVSVALLYPPGPLEPPPAPSYYFIQRLADLTREDAESFLREYNRHMLVVLSIHEALPGHYIQIAWSNACPSRARTVYLSGTFVEGWAKYTERMILEAGFLSEDPARLAKVTLQQRKIHLRAITNTILDVELHAGDMTESQALDLMMKESFQEAREARGKYDRARLTSTQLTTYFAGDTALWRLRRAAETRPGFAPYRFHEGVLAHGSPSPRHVAALMGLNP